MLYGFLADLMILVHLSFVVFVVAGGGLAFWWSWMPWLHLPAAAWGALIEFQGWICPLTPLENALRRRAGEAGYAGGFVEHYLLPVLYPGGLSREIQMALGGLVIAVNAAVYGALLLHRWRGRGT